MSSASASEQVPLPEILIFPARLLRAETTEKILNRIYSITNVNHITVSGEDLPATLNRANFLKVC